MASYFEVTNDITSVIDDSFFNLAIIHKERVFFKAPAAGDTIFSQLCEITKTWGEEVGIALKSKAASTIYSNSPTKLVIACTGQRNQNVPNSVEIVNSSTEYVDVYVFGRPKDTTSNTGLKIYNADGQLVFDANYRYLQPVQQFQTDIYSPVAGGSRPYNNQYILTLPSGREYAAMPMVRCFTILANDDGQGGAWGDSYSSCIAIQSNLIYITSGLVFSQDDVFPMNQGWCRHSYLIIDITGY